ncbi:hypothetical protein, partial [Corynebacterium durum]
MRKPVKSAVIAGATTVAVTLSFIPSAVASEDCGPSKSNDSSNNTSTTSDDSSDKGSDASTTNSGSDTTSDDSSKTLSGMSGIDATTNVGVTDVVTGHYQSDASAHADASSRASASGNGDA